jgi:hypothetical protein
MIQPTLLCLLAEIPKDRENFMDKIIIRQRMPPFKAFKVGDFDEAGFPAGYRKAEKLVQDKNNYPGEYAIVIEEIEDDEVFDLG